MQPTINPMWVRIQDAGAVRVEVALPLGNAWSRFCTQDFTMQSAAGTLAFGGSGGGGSSMLVDNIVIERVPGWQAPIGNFDAASDDRVVGWAFDPDHSADSLAIHVYVDDVFRVEAVANVTRPEVNAMHNITGAHGFDIPVDILALGKGQHKVTVHAIDPDGTGNPPIAPTPRFVTVTGSAPHGWLEAASSDGISGWAADPDSGAPIAVHIYVDGVGVAIVADGWRSDVGAHGFHWTPPALAPGPHYVVVYAIGVDRLGRGDHENPQLSGSPTVYYEGQFEKPGNNGTATCTAFCEGPQWGEVGGCVSGARTDTGADVGCFTRPGLLANGQLLCQCERGFVKPGNNGTVSCGTFCDGAQWGPVGRCVGATRTDTGEQLSCGVVPGLLDAELTCQCVTKLIIE